MTRAWPTTNGTITVAGIPVDQIAKTYDTPCFVTDGHRIRERYQSMVQAFAGDTPTTIAYACKANTSLAIMSLLANEGAAIDAVSPGEAFLALQAGVPADRIFFTGTNPRNDELAWLVEHHIRINIDSLSMAKRLDPLVTRGSFGVRVNPDVGAGHHEHVVTGSADTKFGLHVETLPHLCDHLAAQGHTLTCLHAHIGSGIMDPQPLLALIDAMHRAWECMKDHPAVAIDTIDIGGGLGIPYLPDERELDLAAIGTAITTRFRERFGANMHLALEPGRYLVADSTLLLTQVNTIKQTPHVTFAGVDAGFHTLLRPALYNAYHHIVAATRMDANTSHTYTICGPICETGDVFGKDRRLPELHEGDLLAMCDAGAYGMTMASTYNSRPLPAEVMVLDGKDYCSRARGTFEDLLRGQSTA